jgi:hypothetical protein
LPWKCHALFQPWTNQYCHTSVYVDSSSFEGITTNISCFHIQAFKAFLLGGCRKLWQIEWLSLTHNVQHTFPTSRDINHFFLGVGRKLWQIEWLSSTPNVQHTFPTSRNINHFNFNMLTILSIVKRASRRTMHREIAFFLLACLQRKSNLGTRSLFLLITFLQILH